MSRGCRRLGVGAGGDAAGKQDRLDPEGSGGQVGVREPQGEQSTVSAEQRGKATASSSVKAGPAVRGWGGGRPPAVFGSDQRVAQASGPGSPQLLPRACQGPSPAQPRPAPGLSSHTSRPHAHRVPISSETPAKHRLCARLRARLRTRNQPLKTGCEQGGLRVQ